MTHLHKDYHTSWCGLDASYIPMTHDPASADCVTCLSTLASDQSAEAQEQEAALLATQAQAAQAATMIEARNDALGEQAADS